MSWRESYRGLRGLSDRLDDQVTIAEFGGDRDLFQCGVALQAVSFPVPSAQVRLALHPAQV